jgi:hypothetical protein
MNRMLNLIQGFKRLPFEGCTKIDKKSKSSNFSNGMCERKLVIEIWLK